MSEQTDPVQSEIDKAADKLLEHCDTIVIIATTRIKGNTFILESSKGNQMAIDGSLLYTLRRRETQDRMTFEKIYRDELDGESA